MNEVKYLFSSKRISRKKEKWVQQIYHSFISNRIRICWFQINPIDPPTFGKTTHWVAVSMGSTQENFCAVLQARDPSRVIYSLTRPFFEPKTSKQYSIWWGLLSVWKCNSHAWVMSPLVFKYWSYCLIQWTISWCFSSLVGNFLVDEHTCWWRRNINPYPYMIMARLGYWQPQTIACGGGNPAVWVFLVYIILYMHVT